MAKAPNMAELVTFICAEAGIQRTNVRDACIQLYRAHGYTRTKAREVVQAKFPEIQRALRDHLKTMEIQRKDEYVMEEGTAHLVAIPGVGALRFTAVLHHFLQAMDWREFEILVSNLVQEDQHDEVWYTSGTKDGGFDFVVKRPIDRGQPATFPYAGKTILDNLPLYIMGQAKRYALAKPIDGDLAATLDGKLSRFRNGTGTSAEQALGARLKSLGWTGAMLTVRIVATSSRFTIEALRASVGDSIRLLDGEHLAQRILYLHEGEDTLEAVLATAATLAVSQRAGVNHLDVSPKPDS